MLEYRLLCFRKNARIALQGNVDHGSISGWPANMSTALDVLNVNDTRALKSRC